MREITVNTQVELDAVPNDFAGIVIVTGGSLVHPIHVVAKGSAHVVARGSAHVVARGSAHVVARESVHVVAWGSAHVEAWESVHVVARGSAHVVASKWSTVRKMLSHCGTIMGGIVVEEPAITTADDWCAYYGVTVKDGIAVVYKAVRDDYRSSHDFLYPVGAAVECNDWDGGECECGGGLHFSPSPAMAFQFDDLATRFLACPVALSDMRSPTATDCYPQKIKARRVCGPIIEVDINGDAI